MSRASSLKRLQLTTSWGKMEIVGGSRAGDGTLILLPQLNLALDAGRPHRALPPMSTVAISHGHVDHLGGVGYWASQRHLQTMGRGTLVVPRAIARDAETLLETLARLEGGDSYDVKVVAMSDGDHLAVRKDMDLAFFATDHWVPTLGSRLIWRRHRLLEEYSDLPGDEIGRRRQRGECVTEEVKTHLLSYCADSGPGVLELGAEVTAAEIVLVECSFYRPGDSERARRFGHMHIEDLLARASTFECRHVVLLHASRRHRLREVEQLIEERLRPVFECQIHHLMVDWD